MSYELCEDLDAVGALHRVQSTVLGSSANAIYGRWLSVPVLLAEIVPLLPVFILFPEICE